MSVVFRGVEVRGELTSVRVSGAVIERVGAGLQPLPDDVVIAGRGGALIPGLHDHHIHLAAMAAADRSIDVTDHDFDQSVRVGDQALGPREWLRVVGYDEHVHGPLDHVRLDALVPARPVRVQHRSGALWVLNSVAVAELDAPSDRLFRMDDWLRSRLPAEDPPDIAAVARRLASYGVTGVTDATPSTTLDAIALLSGPLAVRVVAMGGVELAASAFPDGVERGPVKIVVPDHELPALDTVADAIAAAHAAGRPVAIHCVTRVSLILALAAWEAAGTVTGDRIEHGSIIPRGAAKQIAGLGLRVVTQPAFVAARGDRYIADVDADDQPHLYRCASLLADGIEVGGSTDAPFGPEDPWIAIKAAVDRRTRSSAILHADERVDAARAIALFLSPADHPGGSTRTIDVGAPADLCLLDAPLADVLDEPSAQHVRVVMRGGVVTHDASM